MLFSAAAEQLRVALIGFHGSVVDHQCKLTEVELLKLILSRWDLVLPGS